MENDEPKPGKDYPVSASKMSKTPSWIMLGFLLGAAFVAALPPLRKSAPPDRANLKSIEPPAPREPQEPRDPPPLTTIEAVFAEWGKYAVWADDVTEVALWNSRDNAFSDYYEVLRSGGTYYFRTIPRLTRRIIARGKPIPESPLQFTETEEQYREWQKYGRSERPVERNGSTRPQATTPPPAPAPVDRSVNIVPPSLPAPHFPAERGEEKK